MVTNTKGVLHIPLLLAIFLITIAGFRIWGFLRNWRFLVETQLRLDRCVGEVAQEFRDSLNSIEASNQRIAQLRIAIQLAELEPALIPPLQAILLIQLGQQELVRARWELKRGLWLVSHGCGRIRDTAPPLPALRYVRDPPDLIGPQVLHWEDLMPESFEFQVSHRPRHAAAKVEGSNHEKQNHWKANWSLPHK